MSMRPSRLITVTNSNFFKKMYELQCSKLNMNEISVSANAVYNCIMMGLPIKWNILWRESSVVEWSYHKFMNYICRTQDN